MKQEEIPLPRTTYHADYKAKIVLEVKYRFMNMCNAAKRREIYF